MKSLAFALLMLSSPARCEDWADSARPLYRGVERVADGVYGLVRGNLIAAVLPVGLSRRMSVVPISTSDEFFAARLHDRQETASRRLVEKRPVGPMGPVESASWRKEAFNTHVTVVTDALGDALVHRYQLERFGEDSGAYASNPANWDAEFILSAGLLGGAYLYVAGLRTDFNVGPMRVDFDTRPGSAMRSALQNGDGRGLVALRLSRRGFPVSLKAEWGMTAGRMASERVGMDYSARF